MRILVAGGTGFIGTNLCAELRDRGHEVTAMSRDPTGTDLPDGVEISRGDVTAYDSIEGAFEDQDAVVNLVALSPLFEPPADATHMSVHFDGTENVLRAAEAHGVDRFVQLSGLGADPDAPTEFLRAKGQADRLVRAADPEWVIVRPSIVFGDGGEFFQFTKQLTTPYVTGLPGGGSTRFQPIWVGDLVPMLADAVEDDDHVDETYEIGGPEVLTLADVTRLVYGSDGTSVRILPVPMALAKVGLAVAGAIPFVPMGADQARSLELDNTTDDNDLSAFDVDPDGLTTVREYLESA